MLRIVFISALWFGALACLLLGLLTLRRRNSTGALLVTLLLGSVAVYAFGYGLELSATRLPEMFTAVKLEYAGLTSVTPLWFMLSLIFSGRIQHVSLRRVLLLWIVPIIIIVAVATNNQHHLYYTTMVVSYQGPYPAFEFSRGPFYWLHTLYSYGLSLAVTVILIRQYRVPHTLFRRQMAIMLGANFFTLAMSVLYLIGLGPMAGMDIIPFSMILSSGLMGWGILNYRMIDLTPVGRDALFEFLMDPVIILNPSNRLVDFNRAASQTYRLSAAQIGELPDTFLPPPLSAAFANLLADSSPLEVHLGVLAEARTIEMYRVNITAHSSGERSGQIIVLHDATRLKNALQAVEKANDDLNQTLEELTRFNHAMVGREIRMIELKTEINELRERLGIDGRYKIPDA